MADLTRSAASYLDFADNYIRAAGFVPSVSAFRLPITQMNGQAVELALKGYLMASGIRPDWKHDLDSLVGDAELAGLVLTSQQRKDLENTNAIYYSIDASVYRYASRYPAEALDGYIFSKQDRVVALVEAIVRQARQLL